MLGQVYKSLKRRSSQLFLGSQPEAEAEAAPRFNSSQYWPADINEEDYLNVPEPETRARSVDQNCGSSSRCVRRPSIPEDEFDLINTDGESDSMDLNDCEYMAHSTSRLADLFIVVVAHVPRSSKPPRTPTRDRFTATGTQLEQDGECERKDAHMAIMTVVLTLCN